MEAVEILKQMKKMLKHESSNMMYSILPSTLTSDIQFCILWNMIFTKTEGSARSTCLHVFSVGVGVSVGVCMCVTNAS